MVKFRVLYELHYLYHNNSYVTIKVTVFMVRCYAHMGRRWKEWILL